jgi:zinc protease
MRQRTIPRPVRAVLLASALALPAALPAQQQRGGAQSTAGIDIPFQKFVLPNGLTLIVHEDHKAPIAAVNVWYHVGSKNERPGRTGFAHLFEHLMFNGSENFNNDYFQAVEPIGATDLNGTTNSDRTNYFQNVPVSALDRILWLESDRMGHLLGAIDQPKLDEQRGVVQNEKRQGENEPYGRVGELIARSTFPANHPYSWTVIGSMEDLNAAKLEDVHEWFRNYYGAANAVIVVAGDVNPAEVKRKVEQYFGDIPAGPPVTVPGRWVAKRTGVQRARMQDRVPQARVYQVWNVPEWGSLEGTQLQLVGSILGGGKTSRLYKRLVYDEQIATNVSAGAGLREIAGQFTVTATVKPGVDPARVERAITEEVQKFLAEGPTAAEVARVKTEFRAGFIRGIERIGGFGGKSDVLANNMVYGGRPDFYRTTLDRVAAAAPGDLQRAARDWLSDGVYILTVEPFPQYTAAQQGADRSRLPEVAAPPAPRFPAARTATLSNGLRVMVVERDAVPVVNFNLLVNAGYAADQGGQPGTARLTSDMMDEGTRTRGSLELSEELARLGAALFTGANLDQSTVSLSALRENLDASLELFADVVLNPSFPEADFQRLKALQLAAIQQERVSPFAMAQRVMPAILYGQGHAYGNPFSGSGNERSLAAITRNDLARFHQTWFRPNNATLVVVGATTLEEITPKLERLFRGWARGDVPRKNIPDVTPPERPTVYLIDRPGSQQSLILAAHVAPPKNNPQEVAYGVVADVLGGSFISRINMNLREDKHWSYGSGAFFMDAAGQRPFVAYAPVQTDKTKESLQEVMKELREITSRRPITAEELAKSQNTLILSLPGQWETSGAVAGSLGQIVRFGLPEDYFLKYPDAVRALNLDMVHTATGVVRPGNLVWIVVGDRSKIEAGIRQLNVGEVRVIDADGNPVS